MKSLNQRIGKVIRNIREQKGLSQERLAELCDVHEKYVSRLERGLHDVTLKFLYKIANGLEVSVNDLIKSIFGFSKSDDEKDEALKEITAFLQTLSLEDLRVLQRLLSIQAKTRGARKRK